MTTLVLATITPNAVIGIVVVAFMAGTGVVAYQIWNQFRHDKGNQTEPASSPPNPVQ